METCENQKKMETETRDWFLAFWSYNIFKTTDRIQFGLSHRDALKFIIRVGTAKLTAQFQYRNYWALSHKVFEHAMHWVEAVRLLVTHINHKLDCVVVYVCVWWMFGAICHIIKSLIFLVNIYMLCMFIVNHVSNSHFPIAMAMPFGRIMIQHNVQSKVLNNGFSMHSIYQRNITKSHILYAYPRFNLFLACFFELLNSVILTRYNPLIVIIVVMIRIIVWTRLR